MAEWSSGKEVTGYEVLRVYVVCEKCRNSLLMKQ